jgi:hypothetical protein
MEPFALRGVFENSYLLRPIIKGLIERFLQTASRLQGKPKIYPTDLDNSQLPARNRFSAVTAVFDFNMSSTGNRPRKILS